MSGRRPCGCGAQSGWHISVLPTRSTKVKERASRRLQTRSHRHHAGDPASAGKPAHVPKPRLFAWASDPDVKDHACEHLTGGDFGAGLRVGRRWSGEGSQDVRGRDSMRAASGLSRRLPVVGRCGGCPGQPYAVGLGSAVRDGSAGDRAILRDPGSRRMCGVTVVGSGSAATGPPRCRRSASARPQYRHRRAAGRLAELPQPFTTSQARRCLGSTRRVVIPCWNASIASA